jgi:hypothetical protein
MIEMKESDWANKYGVLSNHITNDGCSYETYGDELEHVLNQDNHNVWTELDCDGGVIIANGYYRVNRIQYYITELPWVDGEEIVIPICQYVDCECMDDEGEGKQDCETCYGDGTYTEWSMD